MKRKGVEWSMDTTVWASVIIFWVICGFVGAAISQNRGAGAGIGFVLGLFFGPIGILIACFVGGNNNSGSGTDMNFYKNCEYCAELIRPDAKLCKHCGREQRSSPLIPAYSRPNNAEKYVCAWLTDDQMRSVRVTEKRDNGQWVKVNIGAPTYESIWVESRVVRERMGKPRQAITPLPKRKSN
jgi:hypothetical protein